MLDMRVIIKLAFGCQSMNVENLNYNWTTAYFKDQLINIAKSSFQLQDASGIDLVLNRSDFCNEMNQVVPDSNLPINQYIYQEMSFETCIVFYVRPIYTIGGVDFVRTDQHPVSGNDSLTFIKYNDLIKIKNRTHQMIDLEMFTSSEVTLLAHPIEPVSLPICPACRDTIYNPINLQFYSCSHLLCSNCHIRWNLNHTTCPVCRAAHI